MYGVTDFVGSSSFGCPCRGRHDPIGLGFEFTALKLRDEGTLLIKVASCVITINQRAVVSQIEIRLIMVSLYVYVYIYIYIYVCMCMYGCVCVCV